jgi:hypothetical protein
MLSLTLLLLCGDVESNPGPLTNWKLYAICQTQTRKHEECPSVNPVENRSMVSYSTIAQNLQQFMDRGNDFPTTMKQRLDEGCEQKKLGCCCCCVGMLRATRDLLPTWKESKQLPQTSF